MEGRAMLNSTSHAQPAPTPPGAQARIPDDLVLFGRFAIRQGVHVQTLHRHRQLPIDPMPAWKIVGRWYVSESEFAAWAARQSGR